MNSAIAVLRFGLAFVFVYAAVAIYLRPADWIGFVPAFIDSILDRQTFLQLHALFDLVLAIGLALNVKIFYAAIFSVLNLAGIVIFNVGALDVVFRDIGLLTAAVSLALLSYNENSRR